jgi:hypothetical protein
MTLTELKNKYKSALKVAEENRQAYRKLTETAYANGDSKNATTYSEVAHNWLMTCSCYSNFIKDLESIEEVGP